MDWKRIIDIVKKVDNQEIEANIHSCLTGFSSVGNIALLQSLVKEIGNNCYLEIGVFQGMTLLSTALSESNVKCFGIDNFNFFDPESKNKGLIEDRIKTMSLPNAHLINADYEDALNTLPTHIGNQKVGLFLVDGPHDYRSQLMCLELALPYLSDDAMIIVDDCNYEHVRQANADFLKTHPEFKLIFQSYSDKHPQNVKGQQDFWWDGINVIAKDKEGVLPEVAIPENRSREIFEADHLIHSSYGRELVADAAYLLTCFLKKQPLKFLNAFFVLLKNKGKYSKNFKGREQSLNTFSQSLSYEKFPRV